MEIEHYIATLRDRLADCPMTRDQLAEASGGALSASWLSKFAAGHMDNPRVGTLMALETALDACGQCVERAA